MLRSSEDVARYSVAAGGGMFVLVLLALLALFDPTRALLGGFMAGLAAGSAVWFTGTMNILAKPPVLPPTPAVAMPEGPEAPLSHGPGETTQLSPEEVLKAADLRQTIRLDPTQVEELQFALPEVSPEEILREREGIDEAFLKAGAGIEEPQIPRENVQQGKNEPGEM